MSESTEPVPSVKGHEIEAGLMIYLAPSSSTPSLVVEVGEATHGLVGAMGGLRMVVETYSLVEKRWLAPRALTAWSDDRYRLETEPELWPR